jgi:hypothetical protein
MFKSPKKKYSFFFGLCMAQLWLISDVTGHTDSETYVYYRCVFEQGDQMGLRKNRLQYSPSIFLVKVSTCLVPWKNGSP